VACDELSRVEVNECGNGYDGGRESGFAGLKRVEVPSLPLSERHGGFSEFELCFSKEQAKQETHRGLQRDLFTLIGNAFGKSCHHTENVGSSIDEFGGVYCIGQTHFLISSI